MTNEGDELDREHDRQIAALPKGGRVPPRKRASDKTVTVGFVLVDTADGEYLMENEGGWGPSQVTTPKLSEATVYDESHMDRVKRNWGAPLLVRRVRVTEIIEEI